MKLINCNLCGGSDTKILFRGYDRWLHTDTTPYTLVKCTQCGLVYINPQPTPQELEKYYPDDYPPYQENYQVFRETKTLSVLKKLYHYFKKEAPKNTHVIDPSEIDHSKKTVLDFGCGSGRFLIGLQREHPGWDLHGFDVAANKKLTTINETITLSRDNIENLKILYPQGNFDYIYLNMVLEHVNDPRDTIDLLYKLLRDDGEIIVTVPNIDSVESKIFGKYNASLEIPRHLYHFSPDSLGKLMGMCNLRVTDMKLTGSVAGFVLSFYLLIGTNQRQINPITYRLFNTLINIIGPQKVLNSAMVCHARKLQISVK